MEPDGSLDLFFDDNLDECDREKEIVDDSSQQAKSPDDCVDNCAKK